MENEVLVEYIQISNV